MSGFGIAYDAAVRASLAQARVADLHAAGHQMRRQHWHDQMMLRVIERDRKLDLLDAIEAQLRQEALKPSGRSCPECQGPFMLISSAGVDLDACLACGSFWLDKGELKTLTHRINDIQTLEGSVAPSRFKCPVCQIHMQQHRFLLRNDLLVDQCPAGHGIYLERDELMRSIML